MTTRQVIVCTLALLLASGEPAAQTSGVPVRTLSTPEVELPQQFTKISGIRELSDGRVVLVDPGEKLVALVDFVRSSLTKIGREGSGPGEYSNAGRVLAGQGDTTIIGDLLGRLIKFSPSGKYVGDVSLPAAGRSGAQGRMGAFTRLTADAIGRLYKQASPFGARRGRGPAGSDSVAIQRIDLRTGKLDTAAWFPVPPIISETTRDGGGISPGGRPEGPYVAQGTWVVAPDGRIALVSPFPYQVTWVSPSGQRTVGPLLAFQRVPVTSAEKQAYRENYPSAPNMSVSVSIDRAGATSASSRSVPYREPSYWPETKDPFGNAPNTVLASPTGDVWILKQLPHTEKNPMYDVIGSRGELSGRVVIPARSRVIGFGRNGAVYVVRHDDDDLEYLQRFRLR
jgi:hypothetical protein